jgi:hypothetical protein
MTQSKDPRQVLPYPVLILIQIITLQVSEILVKIHLLNIGVIIMNAKSILAISTHLEPCTRYGGPCYITFSFTQVF